ncbi:MAG: TusE/DsrC/DsvC family sulfur relay protein [Rhodospirillaceae bacterium]
MGYGELDKTDTGYLVNSDEWSEAVAGEIAASEGIAELTQRHWDVIKYLREEYFDNAETQPNDRHIVKAMSDVWGEKISAGDLYDLFPAQPSKLAAKIAGLPESKRKGGY